MDLLSSAAHPHVIYSSILERLIRPAFHPSPHFLTVLGIRAIPDNNTSAPVLPSLILRNGEFHSFLSCHSSDNLSVLPTVGADFTDGTDAPRRPIRAGHFTSFGRRFAPPINMVQVDARHAGTRDQRGYRAERIPAGDDRIIASGVSPGQGTNGKAPEPPQGGDTRWDTRFHGF